MVIISQNGYWEGDDVTNMHFFDKTLCLCLLKFFKSNFNPTVVDLGCGLGSYVTNLRKKGINADVVFMYYHSLFNKIDYSMLGKIPIDILYK